MLLGDLPRQGVEPVGTLQPAEQGLGLDHIPLGGLVQQPVFGFVALNAQLIVGAQLHIVHLRPVPAEYVFHMINVIPVALLVEGPHVGEDHAVFIASGEGPEDLLPEQIGQTASLRGHVLKQAGDHVDGHVIVEQLQAGIRRQSLTDGHFAHSVGAEDDDKFHWIFPF